MVNCQRNYDRCWYLIDVGILDSLPGLSGFISLQRKGPFCNNNKKEDCSVVVYIFIQYLSWRGCTMYLNLNSVAVV